MENGDATLVETLAAKGSVVKVTNHYSQNPMGISSLLCLIIHDANPKDNGRRF